MKITTRTISASEAAYFLQKHLGSLRAWGDFLSDNIRGQQSVSGLTLLPCARLKNRGWQTRYALVTVARFIKDVLALGLKPEAIKSITLEIESSTSWGNNKFDKGGASCRHQTRLSRPRTATHGHAHHSVNKPTGAAVLPLQNPKEHHEKNDSTHACPGGGLSRNRHH